MDIFSKIQKITQNMMTTSNDEVLAAITVRIEKSTYRAAVQSGNPIDYLAKNLKYHLKAHGLSTDELWFTLELAYEEDCLKNPHIHGTIKIKRDQYQDLLNSLQGALGKPLVESAARKRQVKEVYSLEWADYCLKNVEKTSQSIGRRAVFIARPLTKKQSQVFGKNDFSKNAQSPCPDWSESGLDKVLSSYVFNPLKITTKTPLKHIKNQYVPNGLKNHTDNTLQIHKVRSVCCKTQDQKAKFILTQPQIHEGDEKFSACGRKSSPNGQGEQLRKANGTRIQCRQHQDTKT